MPLIQTPIPRRDRWMPPAIAALRGDRTGGVSLTVAAVVALAWANIPGAGYRTVWESQAPWSSPLGLDLSVQGWVNQLLLVAFFALVGLEIRREVIVGELSSRRRAITPVLAAAGGMAAPALIFSAIVAGGTGAQAWGVPMATDVAFALGALALIGGVSPRARVFLMTLAVADDIFSIAILVIFYSHNTKGAWLAGGLAAVVALAAVWTSRRGPAWVRILLAAVAWWAMLEAGVDAAVVGVALGAFGPTRRDPPGARLRHPSPAGSAGASDEAPGLRPSVRLWVTRLEPLVNAVVLPVFALANVGVYLGGSWLSDGADVRVLIAVAVARVLGKPLGIALTTLASTRINREAYQPHIVTRGLVGIGAVASIGFTVPLLIVRTALGTGDLATAAVVGLLAGSLLGVAAGAVVVHTGPTAPPEVR